MDDVKGGPSEAAVEAGTAEVFDSAYPREPRPLAADVLIAAHDPALGLDRSVCLRDVVEALRSDEDPALYDPTRAIILAQMFGGAS